MSVEHTFGELRSLLSQAPSAEVWGALCEHCDVAARDEERFEAEVLPYVLERLRGWPDGLRVARQAWLDEAAAEGDHICLPLVRYINRGPAQRTAKEQRRLWHAPGLRDATMLHTEGLGDFKLHMLRGAPMAPNLRELRLHERDVARKHMNIFGELTGLRALHTSSGRWSLLVFDALAERGRLAALEQLSMGRADLTGAHAAQLGRDGGALSELAVWSNPLLADVGFEALCGDALRSAPLTKLNVGGCMLTQRSMARVAASRWPLRSLYWWGNRIGAAELELLAGSRVIEGLRLLNIGDGDMSGAALAPLLSRRGPSSLRELWIARSGGVGAEGLEAGVHGDVLSGLEVLHAERCGWDARGFAALLGGLSGGSIAELHLASCGLDDAQASALADAELPALRKLDLSNNQITDAGLDALLKAPWIAGLEALDMYSCRVDPDALRRAAEAGAPLKRMS